jgi:hypothetical protein
MASDEFLQLSGEDFNVEEPVLSDITVYISEENKGGDGE